MGALPTLYAATAPDVNGGDYFGPDGFMEARGYPTQPSNRIDAKIFWEPKGSHPGEPRCSPSGPGMGPMHGAVLPRQARVRMSLSKLYGERRCGSTASLSVPPVAVRQPTEHHPDSGAACPTCEHVYARHEGVRTGRGFVFGHQEIARLFLRVGEGMSLRAAVEGGETARSYVVTEVWSPAL